MAFVLPSSGYFIQGSTDKDRLAARGSLTSLTNQNAVRSMEPKRMISKSFLIFKNEQKTKSTLRTDLRIYSVLILEKGENYKMGYRWNNAACSRTAVPSSLNI